MGIEQFMTQGKKDDNVFTFLVNYFQKELIQLKTELSDEEIGILAELKWHQAIKDPTNKKKHAIDIFMTDVVPYLMEIKVSRDRAGRKEAEKILTSSLPPAIEQQTNLAQQTNKI